MNATPSTTTVTAHWSTLLISGIALPILDVSDGFNDRIIRPGTKKGYGEKDLTADLTVANSL